MAGPTHRDNRFRVTAPRRCQAELRWVVDVVLGRFLDLDFELDWTDSPLLTISRGGRFIQTPITFFEEADAAWLAPSSLPSRPSSNWRPASIELSNHLLETETPVLFGEPTADRVGTESIRFGFDLLGTIFFLLSRYEEGVLPDRDEHDRFPPTASVLGTDGLLSRPIVDEYVEILWNAIHALWPDVPAPPRSQETRLSCDVDVLYDPACMSLKGLARRLVGQGIGRSNDGRMSATIRDHLRVRRHGPFVNPYWTGVDRLLEEAGSRGLRATFYFIPRTTDPIRDGDNRPEDPTTGRLIRRIHEAGHEIGVHPGYNTFRFPEAYADSVTHLRETLAKLGIDQKELGSRQHYLRWSSTITPALCEAADIDHDSTLGYAQRPGFRSGTSRDFPMFDLLGRRGLNCMQRPLVLMDCSLLSDQYAKSDRDRDLDLARRIAKTSRHYGGNFNILWHNTSFIPRRGEDLFKASLESLPKTDTRAPASSGSVA
ncbi:MAG: hypothetical protein GY895_01420 [Phycisphaera sp.]|nr:hypothetical protein [Phycisphaera sp.]